MAQLFEALRYKPECQRFDSRWSHWNFSLVYSPRMALRSTQPEYHENFLVGKGGRCVGLTTLPLSCADCLEIWESQAPGTLRACPDL